MDRWTAPLFHSLSDFDNNGGRLMMIVMMLLNVQIRNLFNGSSRF